MHCNNCGTNLPGDANFCWKCGKPQRIGNKVIKPRLEFCEISYDFLYEVSFESPGYIGPMRFIVSEIESDEQQILYCSEWFNVAIRRREEGIPKDEITVNRLNRLLVQLKQDGWGLMERNKFTWYAYRFLRRIRK